MHVAKNSAEEVRANFDVRVLSGHVEVGDKSVPYTQQVQFKTRLFCLVLRKHESFNPTVLRKHESFNPIVPSVCRTQGDIDMYSPQNIATRKQLSSHPSIVYVIRLFWKVVRVHEPDARLPH